MTVKKSSLKSLLTGKAAFNIKGNLTHSSCKIPDNRGFKYCALGSNRLNTIRCQLKKLKLLLMKYLWPVKDLGCSTTNKGNQGAISWNKFVNCWRSAFDKTSGLISGSLKIVNLAML